MPKLIKQAQEETEAVPQGLSPDTWANEYVFEVRYAPNPRVLDLRGKFAKVLLEHMSLTDWGIDNDRIDVFTKDLKTRVFVSWRNAGLIIADSSSPNYFQTQAAKVLQTLFRQVEFGSNLNVARLGVRQRFGTRFVGTFDELKDRIIKRYVSVTAEGKAAVGDDATVVDVGAVLNWKDKHGSFNTNCGPMTKKELAGQFKRGDENPPPDVGLYYDIDYFKNPNGVMMGIEIIKTISEFAHEATERYERIRKLIIDN